MCKGSLQLFLLVWLVCRIIGERTLARGVLIDFSHISRGVNSRRLNIQGVNFLKALIKSAGVCLFFWSTSIFFGS